MGIWSKAKLIARSYLNSSTEGLKRKVRELDILKEREKTDEEKFQEMEDEIALQELKEELAAKAEKIKEEMGARAEKIKEGVKSMLRPDPLTESYKILGATKADSLEIITKKWRDLLKAKHPDKFNEPRAQIKADQETRRINEAYTTIEKHFENEGKKKAKK